MSEILSQSEIDALIAALTTGEIKAEEIKKEANEKKIKVYDFKKPNKFSKEQLNTLHLIHENFSRQLITFFSTQLRTLVQINASSVDQMPYSEFISSIPNPSIIGIVDFQPLRGAIIIAMNVSMAFSIIDRLLGGSGEYKDKPREPTEIEANILHRVYSKLVKLMQEAWQDILEIHPVFDKLETNPQFVQLVSPNEAVALITINTRIGKTDGLINICIPYIVIEPVMSRLSTKIWLSNSKKESPESFIKTITRKLENVNAEIRAEIGKAKITVREFLDLDVGDVIQLDKHINSEVDVYVYDKLKYKGIMGKRNGRFAVRINKVISERDEANG
ncbi:flagellar motor switch protein FliM [Thermosediminibacter oceani]|uniref:Flagellar motor switch protein FliM n=1 Tax=Thermosediminibacter oceani (strain ATCC BAA-1034 / DSM 16646 / JW/IW-1228P) TaxID=555079 RepID=D9S393_THEOJ|nr:flagellar motor switch protein FliM [Thermosediminibacter oceani]ADL07870.1 flagellar motor switch protein FliM [Thermosediminibacter oceani DSM 16646]